MNAPTSTDAPTRNMDRSRPRPTASLTWVTLAASFGFSIGQLDVTIVNVALPRIGHELGMPLSGLQWVVDAYVLAFAVVLLLAGTLCDRFGARRAYRFGLAGFAVASLACGAAQGPWQLIAARAAQGLAVALLVPPSLSLINHACAGQPHRRARAIAAWTAAGGMSIALGPVLGGMLLQGFGWRSIFLVNLPLCAAGLAMTLRVPETPRAHGRSLDLLGQLLAMLSLGGCITAVIEWRTLGAAHPLVWGGALAAVVAGLGFVWSQTRLAQPMLSLELFRIPDFSAAIAYGMTMNFTYYGMLFVLSLFLQNVHHYSAMQAGWAYLPLTGMLFIGNVLSGRVVDRFGLRLPMVLGAALDALGFLLLAQLDQDSSFAAMLPAFVLIPAGMGLAVPAMTTALLGSVEHTRSGMASAALNAARQAAGAIGVALFGALAAGSGAQFVHGMRGAALVSVVLLAGSGVLAWRLIDRPLGHGGARRAD